MPEMSAYDNGVPSWIDLASPDVEASRTFYTKLFGWEANPFPAPEAGGYTIFHLRGKAVAGVGPIMSPDQPPAWMTYVNVTDADATVKNAAGAGGTILMEPMEVMGQGRMAVIADPAGAVVGLWEPRGHIGAQLVNEPGTYCWSELATRNPEGAKAFYGDVFGWQANDQPMESMTYTEFRLAERSVAGMFEMGDRMPAETPPHWSVYIAVPDCDAAVSTATQLGASVVVPAMDLPVGRFAILRDPQGAFFQVISLASG